MKKLLTILLFSLLLPNVTNNGADVSIAEDVTVNVTGDLILNSGNIDLSGNLNVTGQLIENGGSLSGEGDYNGDSLLVLGCTDALACNYNSDANINDDSCDYSCHDNGDYSLYFDGMNDDVKIIDVEGLPQGNDPITMEVSINVENYPEPINDYYIITVGTAWDNQMYAILNTTDQISFAFYGDDLLVPYSLYEKDWIHITTTYDGLNRKIYVNGEMIAEDMTSTASVLGNNIYLAYPDMHGEVIRYNGLMDNIKIWDRALSSNDVLSSYLNNIDYTDNDLLALYKFNQGNEGDYPNILIDYSGNQNHGTIYGAEWKLYADMNDDGLLNILDIIVVANIVIGIFPYDESADLTGDGQVNILDVIFLVNLVLNS